MYRKILAAVNEHTNSLTAARYAIILARACGASLTLLFAANENTDREAFSKAESGLEKLFFEAEEAGLQVETVIERGSPAETVAAQARKRGIDLLFAATRHQPSKEGLLGKSVSRALLVQAQCSVAVVKAVRMGRPAPKRVLMPVGGLASEAEERAFFVSKLAEGAGAKVLLFHVAEPVRRLFRTEVPPPAVEAEHLMPKDMREIARIFKERGVQHEGKIVRGGAVLKITREAAVRGMDLIVVGASGRGFLKTIISGSAVEELLRLSPCNIIIFRPGRHGHPKPHAL